MQEVEPQNFRILNEREIAVKKLQFSKGETVKIKNSNNVGTIIEIGDGNGIYAALVDIGGQNHKFIFEELEKLSI